MNLILFEEDELPAGNLALRDPRAEHLLKTLRKKKGDFFYAGVLDGKLGSGRIEEINADGIGFSWTPDADPPPRTQLSLAVGFPRPIQLRRLLRDCASLGLVQVNLVCTELGEKSYRDTKLLNGGGARSAMIEGALQARDTRLPRLAVYPALSAWLETLSGGILAAADNVRPQGSFASLGPVQGSVSLAVGSERGWSERERTALENAGFTRLSLGSRALRTETACVAAAILLMEKMNLLG